jgi:hypothetical protein
VAGTRNPGAKRERKAAATSDRLDRQSVVMRAFVTRPAGTVLDADQLAATTGLEPRQVGGVCRVLVEGGWLLPVRSDLDHRAAWQRPAGNGHDQPPARAASTTVPAAERLPPSRPGTDYWCRWCKTTAAGPEPPAGWIRVQQRDPQQRYSSRVFQTLALLCSLGCLQAWAAAQTDTTREATA